jgi:hypothetical protein
MLDSVPMALLDRDTIADALTRLHRTQARNNKSLALG